MAGSIKWFIYTTDNGTNFALKADESNVEALNGSTNDFVAATAIRFALPRNVRARFAVYGNSARDRLIKIPVLTQTIYTGVPVDKTSITDPLDADSTLTLVRIRPEVIVNLPFGDDTGQADGDNT